MLDVREFAAEDVAAVARISLLNGQPDAHSGADPASVAQLAGTGTVRVAVRAPTKWSGGGGDAYRVG
jgi:hypothetical protein